MRGIILIIFFYNVFAASFIQPARGPLLEEAFAHGVIRHALEQLGYTVAPEKPYDYADLHRAVSTGEVHYSASHWMPLHKRFSQPNTVIFGPYTFGTIGLYVDKVTADVLNLRSVADLNPQALHYFTRRIAAKNYRPLTGCDASFGCATWLQSILEEAALTQQFDLMDGTYSENINLTINDYIQGKPVIFVGWEPSWLFHVLKLGEDVVPLVEEPLSLYIIANKTWIEENPEIAEFFEQFSLDSRKISEQNYRMRQGEYARRDIRRHVQQYFNRK